MRIAVIGLKPYYESDRVVIEGLKKGHEVVFLSKKNIVITSFLGGEFGIYFTPPSAKEQFSGKAPLDGVKALKINPGSEYQAKITKKGLFGNKEEAVKDLYDIRYFDVVLMREISKTVEWSTIIANYLLKNNKVVVDQKIGTDMYYKTKLGTYYKATTNGFPYPKSFAAVSKEMMIRMLDYVNYPLIVKITESSKGLGVYKFNNKSEVLDFFEYEGKKVKDCMFQECLDYKGDIRVFVVGNKVLGAMRREPQQGQWKGNVAQGAKAYPVEISEEIKKMAIDIVKLQNSEIIGVDVMMPNNSPYIIETNRAPQFHGFEGSTGVNVGKAIIEYLEEKFKDQK